jgi:hypothetical protein
MWPVEIALAALALCASGRPALAQDFRIDSVEFNRGVLHITFPGRADSYYLLQSGPALASSLPPTAAVLGTNANQSFDSPAASAAATFFRVEQIPLTSMTSLLGEPIPDAWKLLHGLNIFDANLLNQLAPGDTRTWLQVYQNQQLPIAYFLETSSSVLADATNTTVQIGFSRSFSGRLTYAIGGTALAAAGRQQGDYRPLPGFLDVTNVMNAQIPVTLIGSPAVTAPKSLLLTLSQPNVAVAGYQLRSNLVHEILIRADSAGTYVGTLTPTNQSLLGPQAIRVALRDGTSGDLSAYFDTSQGTFFRTPFQMPVRKSGSSRLQFLAPASGSISVTNLPERLHWTLTVSDLTGTNGALTGSFTLSVSGLSASGREMQVLGDLRLSASN